MPLSPNKAARLRCEFENASGLYESGYYWTFALECVSVKRNAQYKLLAVFLSV